MRDGWRSVWLFALTSLIADIAGEMVMAVLPFVLLAQGATGLGLGLVGGVADGIGHFMKLVGGKTGQWMRKPLRLVAAGYLVANLSRIGVALAATWPATLAFRSLDRVGKGIRTAPRDAMLADAVPASHQARAFAVHRASDTAGAAIGVLLVLAGLSWLGLSEPTLILVGAAIGFTSVIPLFFIPNPDRHAAVPPVSDGRGVFEKAYLAFLVVSSLFSLGRVTYLFYIVRTTTQGASVTEAVLWYLLYNLVYALASYPSGLLADGWGRRRVLLIGYLLAALATLPFILPASEAGLTLGFVLFGFAAAAVEGNGRALAADLAGKQRRSSRLGEYHALTGFATLLGGVAAGLLWDEAGHAWAFIWCAGLSLVAAGGLAWMLRHQIAKRVPANT